MKPGIKSTEFWLATIKSILIAGLSLAYAFEVKDWQGAITIIGSAIAIGSTVQKYIESRTRVKEAYGKN
jgi:hypothetical protein